MQILTLLACSLILITNPVLADCLYNLTFDSPVHHVGDGPSVGLGPEHISGITSGSPRIVNDQPLLDGNCLELEGGATSDAITLDTGGRSGLFTIDYDVVTSGLNNSKYAFTVLLGNSSYFHSVGFYGWSNTIQKDEPGEGGHSQPFEDHRKYHLTIVADVSISVWTISVDGIECYRSKFKWGSIGSIRLGVPLIVGNLLTPTPGAKVYVDNFKVLHTSVLPPLITGIEALSVDSRSAQLVALVNPRGQPTSATISYRDPSGKETTVATRFLGSGRDDVLLQFPVDSLTPNSQYVLGISATNTSGTNSTNASFTTHAADYSGPLARGDSFHTLSATAPFTVPVSVNDANPDQVATVRLPRQGEVGYNPYVTTDGRTVTFNPPAPKWEGIYYGWTYQFDGNGFFSYFLIVDGVDVSKALVSL